MNLGFLVVHLKFLASLLIAVFSTLAVIHEIYDWNMMPP